MPRQKKTKSSAAPLFDVRVTTAPCVLAIREKVGQWREGGYQGATDTTRQLLNYWFHTDHRLANGRRFAYHWSQREAVETLIYLTRLSRNRTWNCKVQSANLRTEHENICQLLEQRDFQFALCTLQLAICILQCLPGIYAENRDAQDEESIRHRQGALSKEAD